MKIIITFLLTIISLTLSGCLDAGRLGNKIQEEAKPYCIAESITEFKNNRSKYKEKIEKYEVIATRYVKKPNGGMKCLPSVVFKGGMNCSPTYKTVKENYSTIKKRDLNRKNRIKWFNKCMKKQCTRLASNLDGDEKDTYQGKPKEVIKKCNIGFYAQRHFIF
tara:strand:- start:61 stop:549 length:489 start_codon:yes stop_codon:yes gene_type:complete